MLIDFEHHRPMELEEICGAVLSRSRQLQREAPYTFAKKPPVQLSGEVECDEVYVVAGHEGFPGAVKKKGAKGDETA
jgi:hypothetical protein